MNRTKSQLQSYVIDNAACKEAGDGIFIPDESLNLKEKDRLSGAAEFCGTCTVRAECLELASTFTVVDLKGVIMGGYLFRSRPQDAVNVMTREKVANPIRFS